ncbi:cation diffusion facilitator family transporter [Clostridium vincentii]|uniref:Cation efflux family protein n=1 Tax=Clostridium vincentii TaxID=52704 RepID=A0A2T0BKK0_9CLOT|nr:cation transporter [Clostridium vincentii]PRR84387.1 Cation efflux family protein [Clostridium vincentii]
MKTEKNVLMLSAAGGLFFAVLGLTWGIIIQSSMIMFDGLYSLISLFISILAICISNFIQKKDFEKFPFGKGIIEPITVAFQSIVLFVMCSLSLLNGIKELVSGGNSINTGLALGYSIISSIGCTFVYLLMKKKGKRLSSDIIRAESNQWLMDTILSVAVFAGFIISVILGLTSFAYLTRYVDSLMVIITSAVFIKLPVKTLIRSFKEIVNSTASKEINDKIYTIVKNIEDEYKFENSVTRVSKIGRELRIEIDFVFNSNSILNELEEMDKVREQVSTNMKGIKLEKWLNVNFTGDRKWAV